jgi:hypothetical protein
MMADDARIDQLIGDACLSSEEAVLEQLRVNQAMLARIDELLARAHSWLIEHQSRGSA